MTSILQLYLAVILLFLVSWCRVVLVCGVLHVSRLQILTQDDDGFVGAPVLEEAVGSVDESLAVPGPPLVAQD